MREVVTSVRADAVEDALDALMPLFPDGVHVLPDRGGSVELRALTSGGPCPEVAGLDLRMLPAPEDWRERRRLRHRPRTYGGRLAVRPGWADPPAGDLLDVVVDEDASAFGSGEHPTTRACLELLCQLPVESRLADLGCGSGILAIAAARLGWPHVVAVDVDVRSVVAAGTNAERNGVAVDVRAGDLLHDDPPPADLAVANVPPSVHLALAARLGSRTVVATGIENGEQPPVVAAYQAAGYHVAAVEDLLGWVLVVATRVR